MGYEYLIAAHNSKDCPPDDDDFSDFESKFSNEEWAVQEFIEKYNCKLEFWEGEMELFVMRDCGKVFRYIVYAEPTIDYTARLIDEVR